MKITPIQVTVADLTKNYKDDGDGGVFDYDDRLAIRPAYQMCRELPCFSHGDIRHIYWICGGNEASCTVGYTGTG